MVYPLSASKPEGATGNRLASTPATSVSSSSTTPYHLYPSPNLGGSLFGQVLPDAPSDEQRAALGCLQAFDEGTILAWLILIRSLQPGTTLRAGAVGAKRLTNEHLNALSSLSACHDVDIHRWIESALQPDSLSKRPASNSSTWSLSTRSKGSSQRHTWRTSKISSQRSSVSSVGQCSLRSNCSSRSVPRSSIGSSGLFPDFPEGIPEDEGSGHQHWCTYCEHSKPIGTCDGWKRHEREHEVIYRCMPFGAVENTVTGPECAFCGASNPSQSHLQEHHILACAGTTRKPLTLSRRSNLVKHLTIHGIFGEKASSLADKWRYGWNKQAFSCGFCVNLFPTLSDRSNHIDNEHWKHGRDMSEWSLTNVIRGLLLQPGIKEAWESYLTSDISLGASSLRWELPKAEGLQLKLELSEDSAMDLANLAYQCGNHIPWASGQGPTSLKTQPLHLDCPCLDGRNETKIVRGPVTNLTKSNEQQQTMTKIQSNSSFCNTTAPTPFLPDAYSRCSLERIAVPDGFATSGYSSNDSVSMTAFLNDTGHTVLAESSIPLLDAAASAPDSELHPGLKSQSRGHYNQRGLPVIAHSPQSIVDYINAPSSPEGHQQKSQACSWTNDFESRDAEVMLASRNHNNNYEFSNLYSSPRQSLEKPLPPLPDTQEAHSFALVATNFMHLDSD